MDFCVINHGTTQQYVDTFTLRLLDSTVPNMWIPQSALMLKSLILATV